MLHRRVIQAIAILFTILSGGILYSGNMTDIHLSVYSLPENDQVEFRCETIVNSSLGAVVSLFEDTGSMPQWVFRMKEAKTLERINSMEVIAYTVIHLPWPLEDRDSVLHTTISQDVKGILRIEGKDYPGHLPLQKNKVRMRGIRSLWQFEPLADGYLRVTFTGTGDPGGVIPIRIFNNFVHEAPYQTMKKFREMIQIEKYKGIRYSYVKEFPCGFKINNTVK